MKINFNHPCVCRNELSNPRCFTVYVNSTEPRLQTTVRQPGLERSIRHTQGWLKLIFIINIMVARGSLLSCVVVVVVVVIKK